MFGTFLSCSSIYAIDKTPGVIADDSKLDIKLGADIDARYSLFNYKKKYTLNQNLKSKIKHTFATNKGLRLEVAGKSDFGLQYGGLLKLEDEFVEGDDSEYEIFGARRAYIYIENNLGEIRFGMFEGPASNSMKLGAESIAKADGGIDGDFTKKFDAVRIGSSGLATGYIDAKNLRGYYLQAPNLLLDNNSDFKNANKIMYSTPSISGFKASVAYTPDITSNGPSQDGSGKYYKVDGDNAQDFAVIDEFTDAH